MPAGYLALVLHAHLPYVRHPEHARHLEERWLYEAIIECYLPLIDIFDRLEREGVPFALTMSLTPPLAAMLRDELLQKRFSDHLSRMERLADHEMKRLWGDERFAPLATFYRQELARVRDVWERWHGDVVAALVHHWDRGHLELLTCSATHCYLPGMLPAREGIRPQLDLGVQAFEHLVGRRPLGMWLPECAYTPEIDNDIARAGVRFTILDSHGLTRARPSPPFGVHAPIVSPSGIAFFARDQESSRQVWSREEGYPGDVYYRDFYRDIGYDLPEEDLLGEIQPNGARLMTGIKYFRITGPKIDLAHKQPYMPGVARERVWEHAGDFVRNRLAQVRWLREKMHIAPIVVSPYDAELFGHWWYEGPMFLEALFRRMHEAAGELEAVTLRAYLDREPIAAYATPAASSWGADGYGRVWVGQEAAWTWRHVHHATRYVRWLVERHRHANGTRGRALDQTIRELLLLQSSDWNFIIKTGTATQYAEARVRAHVHRLRRLGYLVEQGDAKGEDMTWLDSVCSRDNFLSSMPSEQLRRVWDAPNA
jgi:1,4-alpha-glucan branching enzyme